MIERVLDAFPKDRGLRFLFGVNRTHAEKTGLMEVLRRLRPDAQIAVVENHKDGPVQTVLACAHLIPAEEDVCVNYCDFGVQWSFDEFAAWLRDGEWDGAMSAYRGFHPHSLGPTLYAYMRNEGDEVTEIREKHHFTNDKFGEFASAGLYWFRRGRDLVRLARQLYDGGERVNNEFYVSTLMQLLIQEGRRVGVYELDRFFQWGTPEDLRDYDGWAQTMRRFDAYSHPSKSKASGSCIIPMAGRGQRFRDQGYVVPKPLIDVVGQPMIHRVLSCLPGADKRVLVVQRHQSQDKRLQAAIDSVSGETEVVCLDGITEGQAITALRGVMDAASPRVDLSAPILFAPCDTGYLYDVNAWLEAQAASADLIVWSAKGHLPAIWRPHMYGWLAVDQCGRVTDVAVKQPIPQMPLAAQQVVTGTFWFRDGETFLREIDELVSADDRVNGEFYLDSIARRMVERGAVVRAFCVDSYLPWGTPEELRTFEYWYQVHRAGRPIP
jgi:NDP-sugar pyrophosphorylase family protein